MFCNSGIESKAASRTYEVPFQEPSTSDTQGYLLLELKNNSTSAYMLQVWYWSTVPYGGSSTNVAGYMNIKINSDSVVFTPTVLPYGSYLNTIISVAVNSTTYPMYQSHDGNTSQSYTYTPTGFTVTGFSYYGNVNEFSLSVSSNDIPIVKWGNVALEDNSDIVGSIEQGNQLQEEGNALQEEGNALQEEQNKLQEEANQIAEEQKEQEKNFFDNFFGNLVDSIIGLFIPSSEEMSDLFDQLNQFFSDTFGFLYYPFDFLIQAFDVFLNSDSSTGITFPGFSIMGYEVWPDMKYDIANESVAGDIFGYVRIGTGAILGIFFVGYIRAFFDKRFGGGGN